MFIGLGGESTGSHWNFPMEFFSVGLPSLKKKNVRQSIEMSAEFHRHCCKWAETLKEWSIFSSWNSNPHLLTFLKTSENYHETSIFMGLGTWFSMANLRFHGELCGNCSQFATWKMDEHGWKWTIYKWLSPLKLWRTVKISDVSPLRPRNESLERTALGGWHGSFQVCQGISQLLQVGKKCHSGGVQDFQRWVLFEWRF